MNILQIRLIIRSIQFDSFTQKKEKIYIYKFVSPFYTSRDKIVQLRNVKPQL